MASGRYDFLLRIQLLIRVLVPSIMGATEKRRVNSGVLSGFVADISVGNSEEKYGGILALRPVVQPR